MFQLFPNLGTGVTLTESTICHGAETNTSQLIADHAGPMDPPAQLPTESTFWETEHGQIWHSHLRSSLTAKQEDHAMVATQVKFMPMQTNMVSLKRPAKPMLLKTLIISAALISKDAKTVLLLQGPSQETKETVGLNLSIQSGKLLNSEKSQALTKWKLKFMLEVLFLVVSMPISNWKLTLEVFSLKPNLSPQSITKSQS